VPATLRSLLARPEFRLTVVGGLGRPDVLDRPIAWVHNSDLADPTPWLEPGGLLLTDGVQFSAAADGDVAVRYVDRLLDREVLALGFATEVAHAAIPAPLVAACEARGLLLLEVGARTPFMAIIRYVADANAAEQTERLEWSLEAQRAVARAALRPDGLAAVLRELESRMGCWVALLDALGERVATGVRHPIPASVEAGVAAAARAALARGMPAAVRVQADDGEAATLQTLGRRGRLRGVLVVGAAAPLDAAKHDVVSAVIGLASVAAEQGSALESARLRVRSAVLELLLAGVLDVAGRTAGRLWGRLPVPPLRVGVVVTAPVGQTLLDELERYADRHPDRLFFAQRDDEVVLVLRRDGTDALAAILGRHAAGAGVSAPVGWKELSRGLDEARRAARRVRPGRACVPFEDLADEGLLGFLDVSGAEPVARRLLAPVLDSANPDHGDLLRMAAVWLEHQGAWDPAARELHVHRHTLRNRLQVLEGLLGLDLSRFSDRAELWSAIQLVGDAAARVVPRPGSRSGAPPAGDLSGSAETRG